MFSWASKTSDCCMAASLGSNKYRATPTKTRTRRLRRSFLFGGSEIASLPAVSGVFPSGATTSPDGESVSCRFSIYRKNKNPVLNGTGGSKAVDLCQELRLDARHAARRGDLSVVIVAKRRKSELIPVRFDRQQKLLRLYRGSTGRYIALGGRNYQPEGSC